MVVKRSKFAAAFTVVELMVVILIVGILAVTAAPLMRSRIDTARWSEGKSMMGAIATAIRAYTAEKNSHGTTGGFDDWGKELGFLPEDLDGTCFRHGMFEISSWTYDRDDPTHPLAFTIKSMNNNLNPTTWTLNQSGAWGH